MTADEERRRQKLKAAVATASQAQKLLKAAVKSGPRLTGLKASASNDESTAAFMFSL